MIREKLTPWAVVLVALVGLLVANYAATFLGSVIAFLATVAIIGALIFLIYVAGRRVYDRLVHSRPVIRNGTELDDVTR